mgnify:CR=1 FL=1|tara:strand:- start:971 stop:1627 length:657 start_codon:yes stop_codon:yes gene_type:complete
MQNIYINGISGKMGQSITKLIKEGNEFAIIKDEDFSLADTVIDFSHPLSTSKIVKKCIENKIPLIIGTTGLDVEQIKQINDAANNIPILLAANMSFGINDLKKSIQLYIDNELDDLSCLIEEIHHTQKTDKPSGTAIEIKNFLEYVDKENIIKSIKINSIRKKDVYGIHKIAFYNKNKINTFKHEALSRDVFARGALQSVKAIKKLKPNIYKISDILN